LEQGHLAATPTPAEPAAVEAPAALVPLAKPPVRKLARDLGVDLRSVTGTGAGGVITRDDVRAHTERATEPVATGPGVRREPVRGVRKATAAAVVASAFTAPHVTEFLAVDVTATMALRDRLRATREYADVPLSPLAFVAKAVCLALRRTPVLNARWTDEEITYHDRVRLGIAAATPRGLLVPSIRDADTLTLRELAEAVAELATTARAGRTPPADLTGGTFTITNVGVFGVDSGTPILNPGEAGILAVGAIKEAPWVVDGALAVRTVCRLALSFDHRLVDGEQGSRFLADVGALLTDPGLALTW
jgi:2-oxoisovalerate dehydrogenase E2 component (dihydrolipoyl transacylase)